MLCIVVLASDGHYILTLHCIACSSSSISTSTRWRGVSSSTAHHSS